MSGNRIWVKTRAYTKVELLTLRRECQSREEFAARLGVSIRSLPKIEKFIATKPESQSAKSCRKEYEKERYAMRQSVAAEIEKIKLQERNADKEAQRREQIARQQKAQMLANEMQAIHEEPQTMPEPTQHPPGSVEKIEVLSQRYFRNEEMHHPDDYRIISRVGQR